MVLLMDIKSVALITAGIFSEFDKRKWPEEYEGFATKDERKANTRAKQVVLAVRKGNFEEIKTKAEEAAKLDSVRWAKFSQYVSDLCSIFDTQ